MSGFVWCIINTGHLSTWSTALSVFFHIFKPLKVRKQTSLYESFNTTAHNAVLGLYKHPQQLEKCAKILNKQQPKNIQK